MIYIIVTLVISTGLTFRYPTEVGRVKTDTNSHVMSSQDIVLNDPLLLETIFLHLTPSDLKAVTLVSR